MNYQFNNRRIIIIISLFLVIGVAGSWWQMGGRALFLDRDIDSNQERGADNGLDRILAQNRAALDQAAMAQYETVASITEADRVRGPLNAPVQVIVYEDFECEFCAGFQETLKGVIDTFGDQVVVAYRHYPLRNHPNAYDAALAAECAAAQEKFWEAREVLYAANRAGSLGQESYAQMAATLGLDAEKFDTCRQDEAVSTALQDTIAAAKRFGVSGTPTTFVNGELLPGATPLEDFSDSQNRAREGLKTVIERHLQDSK